MTADAPRRTAEEVIACDLEAIVITSSDPMSRKDARMHARFALAALDRAGYVVVAKDTRLMAESLDDIVCGEVNGRIG